MDGFSRLINSFEYKADPYGGLWDFIDTPDNFFNKDKKEGRDCDDWSRMWSLWGVYNKYRAYEYVVCNPTTLKSTFSTMHCITVLYKDNKYWLMNYKPYGPYCTLDEALDALRGWKDYATNKLVVLDREITIE